MRQLLCLLLLIAFADPATAAPSYLPATVQAAEEALQRLGYDVGLPDGKWDTKTTKAMNELRAANGLPPAKTLTGSSLALVHRLSPGTMTLAHPGMFVVDAVARRKVLSEATDLASDHCPAKFGNGPLLNDVPLTPVITSIKTVDNHIAEGADWFSAQLESLVAAQGSCLAGNDKMCQAIIDFTEKSAISGALRPKVDPPVGPKNEDLKWIGNIMLRNIIVAYGIARQFSPLPPQREAIVLDWMKQRVDQYHNIVPDTTPIGDLHSARYNNHGLAHMMPAFMLGVLIGDRSIMQPALDTYLAVLKGLRKDGSIPTETRRGSGWYHYSNLQIGQLLAVSAVAKAQGIDLGDANLGDQFSIPHAVEYLADALTNFELAYPYAKANEGPTFGDGSLPPYIRGFETGWIPTYIARFGNDASLSKLLSTKIDARLCSPEGLQNDKIQNNATGLCFSSPDHRIPFARLIRQSSPRANNLMGLNSGCLQADDTWNVILGIAKKN